jgi:putative DNA primase/helicase
MVAKLGFVPTGSAPDNEEEIRKVLDSAVHYGVPILFFDNLKGHLSSGELEAFITGSTRRYRMLGTTNYTEADNLSTVYITANFATYSPDLRRRLLAVELFLEESRAEQRSIKHFLDEDALIKKRPRLLSMLWAFIKHWHNAKEKPSPKPLPSFEQWSNVVGGIVEYAGFSSPCQLATLKTGGDTDTQDMEKLVSEMNPDAEFKFSDLIDVARDHHLFTRLIPGDCDMDKKQSTRMGYIVRKFVGRIFSGQFRFCLSEGTRKTERYYVTDLKKS